MHAHRPATIATLLVAAWLSGACQSPVRPTAQSISAVVPPTADFAVSLVGVVLEAPAEPGVDPMPLAGATVSAIADVSGSTLSAVTDDTGWFLLSSARGTVTITVAKDGYETLVTSVDMGEDTRMDFELKRAE